MNYLAHFYLSGEDDEVLYGNFIGDSVKGKQWQKHPENIRKGILLHRFIDDFIDKHPFAQNARKRIRKTFGITSAVVLDVYFDHFLSINWLDYHIMDLGAFSQLTFNRLRPFKEQMPAYYPMMFEKMESENWIDSYRSIEGTALVLNRMSKRVRFENNWHESERVLKQHYEALDNDFKHFFPEIIKGVSSSFNIKLFNSQ
jgi:acyl carrier protein phosphodiesterase